MDTSETGLEKIIVGWLVKEEERAIVLENENTNVKPIPVGTGGGKSQPEMDALSSIVKDFNDTYGNIEWKNRDEVQRQIEELPSRIATSVDFANAVRNGDKQVAQITLNDDIVEGNLCYLLVAIANGIRKVNTGGNTCRQFLNLTLNFVTVLPLDVAVGVVEVLHYT